MVTRKALSKQTRFEILKRDGFRCRYCGATPDQVLLHIDHVVPVADGGTDDPENLAASCRCCNLGKSDVPLDKRKLPLPVDATELAEQVQQIRDYLDMQTEAREVRQALQDHAADLWEERIGPMTQTMYSRMPGLLREHGLDRVTYAIDITAGKYGNPGQEFHSYIATRQSKYFHGVLRRIAGGVQ